jgi:hypothetical protein
MPRDFQDSDFPLISTEAMRGLIAAGVMLVEDLTQFTEAELANIDGVDEGDISILKNALRERGLSFALNAKEDDRFP